MTITELGALGEFIGSIFSAEAWEAGDPELGQ